MDSFGSGSGAVSDKFKQSNDINFGFQKKVAKLLRIWLR